MQFKNKYTVFVILTILSYLLFARSFSYNIQNSSFLIASNLYQDFGAHIANIRYFASGGTNIEVPFFAGGGLMYHFMFDLCVGIVERIGLRIDITYNLISALSLSLLFILLYKFASKLFKNKFVGMISPVLFILNSDLSFIQVIQKYGLSLISYYHHNTYTQGRIWDVLIEKNFLNINTFLNQRHMIFALCVFLYVINKIIFEKKLSNKSIILLAVVIGLLPFWHFAILIALYIFLFSLFAAFKEKRQDIGKIIFLSLLLVIPQAFLIKHNLTSQLIFYPGFIIQQLSLKTFILFWIWNLGTTIPLAVYGFRKSNTFQKKVILSFFPIFILANLFKFAPDIFDNHKFFNVWIMSMNVLAAWGLYNILSKKIYSKFVFAAGIILATTSGFLNLLVVKNDVYVKVQDSYKTSLGVWVSKNINQSEILITNAQIYDPISLLGRRTFLGRPQYIFLYGGSPNRRAEELEMVLEGRDDKKIKQLLQTNNIKYIVIYKWSDLSNILTANKKYFDRGFIKVYEDNTATVYKI